MTQDNPDFWKEPEIFVPTEKVVEEPIQQNEDDGGQATRDFCWYQNLRRENPARYYTPAVQQQIIRDSKRQGDDFYKGKGKTASLFSNWTPNKRGGQ